MRSVIGADAAVAGDHHPTDGAFPTTYIIEDLAYARALAETAGLTLEQAGTTRRLMERTAAAYGDSYYTAVIRTIEKRTRGAFGDQNARLRVDVYPGPAPCVET